MAEAQGTLEIAKTYRDALTRGDLSALKGLMSEELWQQAASSGIPGNANVEIHDFVATDDRIVGRFSFTVGADSAPGAKPGSQARVSGMSIARVEQGRIVEFHHEIDKLGVFEQLGVTPPHLSA